MDSYLVEFPKDAQKVERTIKRDILAKIKRATQYKHYGLRFNDIKLKSGERQNTSKDWRSKEQAPHHSENPLPLIGSVCVPLQDNKGNITGKSVHYAVVQVASYARVDKTSLVIIAGNDMMKCVDCQHEHKKSKKNSVPPVIGTYEMCIINAIVIDEVSNKLYRIEECEIEGKPFNIIYYKMSVLDKLIAFIRKKGNLEKQTCCSLDLP